VAAFAGTVEVETGELAAAGTVGEVLRAKLEVLKEASEKRVRGLLQTAATAASFQPRPVYQATGEAAPFHFAGFEPDLEARLQAAVGGLAAESEGALEADLVTLGRAVEWATQRVSQGEATLLLTPVHFGNLMTRRNLARYVELCRSIGAAVRGSLMFELIDLPDTVATGRVLEIAQTLMPHARGLAVELVPGQDLLELFGPRTPLATISQRALPRLAGKDERFARLVRALRARKTRLVAKQVRSKDDALKLARAGIELVSFAAGQGR
jgi:hypothetical protein